PAPTLTVAPAVRYPVGDPESATSTTSPVADGLAPTTTPSPPTLPALDASDAPLLAAATPLFGARGLPGILVPDSIIERLVVTIDNLDRAPIRQRFRPVETVPGRPEASSADTEDAVRYLPASNTERYTPYVRVLEALEPAQVADLYRRYYPLVQQAYRNMGYPDAYFNDRLIDIIDHLLATPRVTYPLAVVQPKVFYEFADPQLEARSWGQKALIRLGPEHMATVKNFLRTLRASLVSTVDEPG
ncbi:MAG: DUF3014 domain-containing protein, partial [Oceanococcaceae bacterium]